MSRWGPVKMAKQRQTRMEAAGIYTSAGEDFKNQLELIDQMDISRKEKTALKEAAAETYLSSGYSTQQEIHESFEALGAEYLEEINDPRLEAQFLGAADDERAAILARHYIGSDAVQYTAQAVGDDSAAFYRILTTVVTEHWNNPSPDAVTSLINQMVDAMEE